MVIMATIMIMVITVRMTDITRQLLKTLKTCWMARSQAKEAIS